MAEWKKECEGVSVRPRNRFWAQWWFWLTMVALAMILLWTIGVRRSPNWAQQFSANLLSDLLVAIAIGVLVVGWLERRARAEEKAEKARKVLELLRSELHKTQSQVTEWLETGLEEGWIPTNPLPTGGWRSVSSGPLLDNIPAELLFPLLHVYTTIEDINVLLPLLIDLSVGISQSLSTAKKNRERICEVMKWQCGFLVKRLDEAIRVLNIYLPERSQLPQ